jgi:hypothetical protein
MFFYVLAIFYAVDDTLLIFSLVDNDFVFLAIFKPVPAVFAFKRLIESIVKGYLTIVNPLLNTEIGKSEDYCPFTLD